MKERSGLVAFWKNYDRKQVLRYAQIADELGMSNKTLYNKLNQVEANEKKAA